MTNFPASHRDSFAPAHQGTATAGRAWHAPDGGAYTTSDRPRGMVAVDDGDGSRLFYRVSRRDAGKFRRWAEAVFLANDGRDRIAGRFPEYGVEAR